MIFRTITIVWVCMLLCAPLCRAEQRPAPKAADRDAEIKAAVTAYIKQKTANLGYEIRIKRISINGNLKLPEGALEYEVMAPRQWEGWGTASLAVLARLGDRVVSNSSVRVEVEALADMVVALRQLDRGAVISGTDIAVQKREIAAVSGTFAGNAGDVVGKQTRITIKANAVVRTDQLEKVPLVKSGQMVTIVAENAVMKVSVAGKAKNSGAEGDIILVQNLNSLKDIPARVVNATTVQVGF